MRGALVLCLLAFPCVASAQELGTLQLAADDGSSLRLHVRDESSASEWRQACVLPCSLVLDAREVWAVSRDDGPPVRAQLHLRGAPSALVSLQDRHQMRDDGAIVLAVFSSAAVASLATGIGIYAGLPQDNGTFLAEISLIGAGILCVAIALAVGLPLAISRDIARITSGVPLG